jgi:DNA primase
MIICLVCKNNDIFTEIEDRLDPAEFIDENDAKLVEYIRNAVKNKQEASVSGMLGKMTETDAAEYTSIMTKECNCDDSAKAVNDLMNRINGIKYDRRKKEILALLEEYKDTDEKDMEKMKLQKELTELQYKIYVLKKR